jgi:hypothetical protein
MIAAQRRKRGRTGCLDHARPPRRDLARASLHELRRAACATTLRTAIRYPSIGRRSLVRTNRTAAPVKSPIRRQRPTQADPLVMP